VVWYNVVTTGALLQQRAKDEGWICHGGQLSPNEGGAGRAARSTGGVGHPRM
jgi:hypothetical protein